MTFSESYGDTTYRVILEDGGKVYFSNWCDNPHSGGAWSDSPYGNLSECIRTLNNIGSRSPEVYRAVYEHIKQRTEQPYIDLANYCKRKNNEIAQKFQIID